MVKQYISLVSIYSSERTCVKSWSSLVEGDEQLDRPNSQTIMELYHARVA